MKTRSPRTFVVVSHTHWDREWYQPLGVFRERLAALIDNLLDAPDGLPFLLDGQAIVLDDYRELRTERMPEVRAALQAGQLEAGPWYVLTDLQIPSGEALVRNLLEGMRTVRDAGGTPPSVLYSPDAFGHAAAGPLLAEGFGFGLAIVWRGYGAPDHPAVTAARWTHPSGASVLLYHLPRDGYEAGSSLPTSVVGAEAYWHAARARVVVNSNIGVVLLPNGADHHARQVGRDHAVAALTAAAVPDRVVVDSLGGFAQRVITAAADVSLPEVSGELRDSTGWTWALQGTLSTRASQKRTNAQLERLLVRDTEPWHALAWFTGSLNRATLRSAWKTLLGTHPHDTLCGCSIDDVATAADARWSDVRHQATAIRDDTLRALVQCDSATQRGRESAWVSTVVLRNPASRARGGAIRLRLLDRVVPDPVGPGSASGSANHVAPSMLAPGWSGDEHIQALSRAADFDRVESPLHYPRNAVVRVTDAMAWIAPMPGYAVNPVALTALGDVAAQVPDAARVLATESTLTSVPWQIEHTACGVTARHVATSALLQPSGWLESQTDAGDTYTPSLRGHPIIATWSPPTVRAAGPIVAEWEVHSTIDRPRNAITAATEPTSRELPLTDIVRITATATIALTGGTDRIDVTIRGENPAGDHRLRWIMPLPAGIDATQLTAEAAFGSLRRVHSTRDPREWPAEQRLPTAPLHRWLALSGATYGLGIVSDGLAEYELLPDGHLAITLVRAIGELSRRDLPERPGHAGWPAATPNAQSRGAFEARFSIVILPADHDVALAQIEATADDFLLPIIGDTWRGVATALPPFVGLTLEGAGLSFSAAKRSDDGQWLVLRCINQRATTVRGAWHLPRAATEVRTSRLDESPGPPALFASTRVPVTAPPFSVVTLLVR